jgi:hypothetical protein
MIALPIYIINDKGVNDFSLHAWNAKLTIFAMYEEEITNKYSQIFNNQL